MKLNKLSELLPDTFRYTVFIYEPYSYDVTKTKLVQGYSSISNDEFTIYLNPDIVTYSYGDEYDDAAEEFEDEDIAEATRVIKVSSIGQKHIKMKCNPGFKWESESRSCQKISGEDLVNMRKGIKKRLITMKSEGPSLKKRTLIKTRKAMKFRKVMGLS